MEQLNHLISYANDAGGREGVINPFSAVVFVLPVLVPPTNGLKESLGEPGTLSLRHLFHMGMHKIVAFKQAVIRHISKQEKLCR